MIAPTPDSARVLGQIARGEVRAGAEGAREIAARHEAAYGDVWAPAARPELVSRRTWLAAAVQAEPTPVTTHRAAELLAASPWPTSGRNTARKDLRALAARGVLAAVDTDGRRTYTLGVVPAQRDRRAS